MARKKNEGGVEQVVSSKVLVALVKESARIKSEGAELRGGYGSSVKSAKKSGLDARALKVIETADTIGRNRGIAARDAFLRNITLYADKMIEERAWESFVGDLADQAAAAAEAAANANQADQPVPADDEQPEEDLRSHAQKEAERARIEQEAAAADVVASNVTKLRGGLKKKRVEGDASGSYAIG